MPARWDYLSVTLLAVDNPNPGGCAHVTAIPRTPRPRSLKTNWRLPYEGPQGVNIQDPLTAARSERATRDGVVKIGQAGTAVGT